ncbi:MAG: HEAT repeat domain-containing protein [Acidobacteriaceae bacterium]|nr:HEAT repeat domain-containing protein [Acidobacteriaceae bacterium]
MDLAVSVGAEVISTTSVPRESVPHMLANLASTDPDAFMTMTGKLRYEFPQEVAYGCFAHLATRTRGKAFAHALEFVLSTKYLDLLTDPNSLSPEQISEAVAALRDGDPQFFVRFTVLLKTSAEVDGERLLRSLVLLEGLSDYSVLLSVLRGLTNHPDGRVGSKAAKLLCRVRPNKPLVERQLLSPDSRVRANAVEALWFDRGSDSKYIFRRALSDKAHRVVVNALIGLYYQEESDAFDKLLLVAQHPVESFREAAIWAFNHLSDARAIPALEALSEDSSENIRSKAQAALRNIRDRTETDHQLPQ